LLVLQHIDAIKRSLGISGVETRISTWRCVGGERGAQIDLLIDRQDNTINICEAKFSVDTFYISKDYEANLRNKLRQFIERTKMKKSIQLTLVTTYGLERNTHSGVIQKLITLDDLFA